MTSVKKIGERHWLKPETKVVFFYIKVDFIVL